MKIPQEKEGIQKRFFARNFSLLVEKNPAFTFFTFPEEQKLVFTPKGWNLKKKNQFFYTEEELEKGEIPPQETGVLFFYGLGLGYPFFFLENWLKEDPQRRLHFLEKEKSLLFAFLQTSWAEKILRHPQVKISFVEKKERFYSELQELIEVYAPLHPTLQTGSFYASKKQQQIQQEVEKEALLKKAYYLDKLHSDRLFSNLVQNTKFLNQSSYLNRWENAFFGVPAIVGGAGPSSFLLQKELKSCYDKALILAGGATLAAFSKQGIGFHLGVALDPNQEEENLFQQNSERKVPLIYTLRTYPKAIGLMEGPLIYAKMAYISALEAWLQKKRGLLQKAIGKKLSAKALSVTCFSIAIAQFLGCNPIILVGVDLSYEKTPYAAGISSSNNQDCLAFAKKVFPVAGKGKVFTHLLWQVEQEAISDFAKKHPQTLFLDASEKGLLFSHIPYLPFSQIAKKYLTKKWKIQEKVKALLQETQISSEGKELLLIRQSLLRIKEQVQCIRKNCTQQGKIQGKGVLAELELKEELAFRLLFSDTLYYLQKSLAIQTKDATKKWLFFQKMIEKYLQAFSV